MSGALTSLVAVAGTLLGSLITFIFQRKTAERTEELAWRRMLRAERLEAYSSFAGAVVAYRQAQYGRFRGRLEAEDGPAHTAAKEEAYRRRMAAQQALFRVQLVCVDPDLILLAEEALEATKTMDEAAATSSLRGCAERAQRALNEFVRVAGGRVHLRPQSPS